MKVRDNHADWAFGATRRELIMGVGAAVALTATNGKALAAAGGSAGDPAYPALRALLNDYVANKKVAGAVIGVRKGSAKPVFISAGTLAFDSDRPMTPTTICRAYSMTKAITGVATMKLIEMGKLRLDQELADIFPEFSKPRVLVSAETGETRPAARPITIRHLLTHTAGLSYYFPGFPLYDDYKKATLFPGRRGMSPPYQPEPGSPPAPRDLMEFMSRLATLPLASDPGTRFQYSVAPDVLGAVMEKVSGMSYYDFLRVNLFEPLNMPDTDFMVPLAKLDRFATNYGLRPNGLVVVDQPKTSQYVANRELSSGGGGLTSTAHDYDRFCGMLLNGGTLDGRRVLRPESVRLACSDLLPPGVIMPEYVGWSQAYVTGGKLGFGAQMQRARTPGEAVSGPPVAYGWGGAAGCTMWIDPVNRLAFTFMTQRAGGNSETWDEVTATTYRDLRIGSKS